MTTDYQIVRINLKTETDVSITKSLPVRNLYHTEPLIPAQTLRGSLLTAIMRNVCNADYSCSSCDHAKQCPFPTEVLPGFIQVAPGVPKCPYCDGTNIIGNAPKTYMRCKVCEGLSGQKQIKQSEGILYDRTTQWVAGKAMLACEEEGHQFFVEPAEGIVCLDCKKIINPPKVHVRPNTAISSETGAAETGQLFFYEVLEEGTEFVTEVVTNESTKKYLDQTDRVFVGRGSSRGLGWIKLETEHINTSHSIKSVEETLRKTYETYRVAILFAKTEVLSVNIHENLLSAVPYLKHIAGNWSLNKSKGLTKTVGGWSLKTDLQKPLLVAAEPGSVFVYETKETYPDFTNLAHRIVTGIGQDPYIRNGFNQFIVWRP